MLKRIKKIIKLGYVSLLFSPIITIVSCSDKNDNIELSTNIPPSNTNNNNQTYNLENIKNSAISIINALTDQDIDIKSYKNIKDEFLKLFTVSTKWIGQIDAFTYYWDSNTPNFPKTVNDFLTYCQNKINSNTSTGSATITWTSIKSKLENLGSLIGANNFIDSLDIYTKPELEIIFQRANNPLNLPGSNLEEYKNSIKNTNTRESLNTKLLDALPITKRSNDSSLASYWHAYDMFIRQLAPTSITNKSDLINKINQLLNVDSSHIQDAVKNLNHLFANYNLPKINIDDFKN